MITLKEFVSAYPYFPWEDVLSVFASNGTEINKDEIIVAFTSIFEVLEQFLRETPKRTVANYFVWRAIWVASEFSTEGLRDLKSEYDLFVTGIQKKVPRWRMCVMSTLR